eukprot:655610-Rhodomonas_salina.2
MSGTDRGHAIPEATKRESGGLVVGRSVLLSTYAAAMPCPVLASRVIDEGMASTVWDPRYLDTRPMEASIAISIRGRYALSVYAPDRWCPLSIYAPPRQLPARRLRDARYQDVLCCYAPATRCPVLRSAMLLPGQCGEADRKLPPLLRRTRSAPLSSFAPATRCPVLR